MAAASGWLRWGVLGLWALSTGLTAATIPEQMACIEENLPAQWMARMTVRATEPDGTRTEQVLIYADRRDASRERVDTALQLMSPTNLRGVAHLYVQRGDTRRQFSFLPAIGRVREVKGGSVSLSVVEGVPGLAELESLWRWPRDAAISMGPVATDGGHAVQTIRANRRVGVGDAAAFERFEGHLDLRTCVIVAGQLTDPQGVPRLGMTVDRRSLQAYGPHWLPRRIDIAPTASGGTAVITLDAVRIAPDFPRGSFDPERFHQVGLGALLRPN